MKKTFIVTETRTSCATWTYEVLAETEAEAIELVQDGDIEHSEYQEYYIDFENNVDLQSNAEYSASEA